MSCLDAMYMGAVESFSSLKHDFFLFIGISLFLSLFIRHYVDIYVNSPLTKNKDFAMPFRHDINALRALAVLTVVLFHFNESVLPGGFIGVDVFFVLSGYLMTGIIFNSLDNNFSLLSFFKSRAQRILPPLMAICLSLLIFGWFFLPPPTYAALGKHIISSLSFISNIVYWTESGYFDSSSHGKFLLHTWSLSVEWQFYILYPIALKILHKVLSKAHLKILIVISCFALFILSLQFSVNQPVGAFFLLQARVWELLFGGILFLYPLRAPIALQKPLEIIGISILVLCSAYMSRDINWPAPWALLPLLGTACIIIANQQNSSFSRASTVTFIGQCSYSIYLWHWPVAVTLYYLNLMNNTFAMIIGILLSFLLGALSFKIIEQRAKFSYPLVGMFVLIVCAAAYLSFSQGIPNRFTPTQQDIINSAQASPKRNQCHSKSSNFIQAEDACQYPEGIATWAVIGDSHGVELAYALSKLLPTGEALQHYTLSTCAPSFKSTENNRCTRWTNNSVQAIKANNAIQTVLISYRYSLYLEGELGEPAHFKKHQEHILRNLHNMVTELALTKQQIFIVAPVPEMPRSIQYFFNHAYLSNHTIPSNLISMRKEDFFFRNEIILTWLNKAVFPENVRIIHPSHLMCNADHCSAIRQATALYFDDDHLSIKAAHQLLKSQVFIENGEQLE